MKKQTPNQHCMHNNAKTIHINWSSATFKNQWACLKTAVHDNRPSSVRFVVSVSDIFQIIIIIITSGQTFTLLPWHSQNVFAIQIQVRQAFPHFAAMYPSRCRFGTMYSVQSSSISQCQKTLALNGKHTPLEKLQQLQPAA